MAEPETSSDTNTSAGETSELRRQLSIITNQPWWLLRHTFKKPSSFNLSENMAETSSNTATTEPQHQISIPMPRPHQLPAAPPLPPKRAGPKRPSSFYLSEEQRENYTKICVPLYNAALKGDWHAAEDILRYYPKVINMSITKREETVLHIVASTKHTYFAENLVNKMEVEDLELQNRDGETALCLAVASTVKMVDILLERNNDLLKIRKDGDLPFLWAVLSGDKKIAEHIYRKTNLANEKWNYSDKKRILDSCLAFGLLDIASEILITTSSKGFSPIHTQVLRYLAYNPSAFVGTMRPGIRRLINAIRPGPKLGPIVNFKAVNIVKTICEDIVTEKQGDMLKQITRERLLFTAARLGNYKFIMELLKLYPDITWDRDDNKHTIFHLAVMHRQENVYNLLIELGSKKLGIRDKDGNNILHLAAIKPMQSRLNSVSGAALQMQRELLWFQEVKTIVSSVDITRKNKEGKTPDELFTIEHTELMEKGESWLKETAIHCMVVAALIATIMFAAAFTLPGGYESDNGHPLFMKRSAFTVFVVTDAISLFTSSTSILMFLAILTARYQESDYLVILPLKLMVGLITLFISIATMVIAFSASFFLLYSKSMKFIPILVTALAAAPVILSVTLKHHLLFDVIYSTFNSRHLFRPKKRMFF